jgi:hypothetical protein
MGTLKTPRITICRLGVKISAASNSRQATTVMRRKADMEVPGEAMGQAAAECKTCRGPRLT